MHIFIDESGGAIPSEKNPVACVIALVVPDSQLDNVNKWFLAIENEYGKPIKGRKIDQKLRKRILSELLKFDVFVECAAIDMTLHSDEITFCHKENRACFINANPPTKTLFFKK